MSGIAERHQIRHIIDDVEHPKPPAAGELVGGDCVGRGASINVHEFNPDYPDLRGYCANMTEKIMAK
ncbi:hypothetical protein [Martelella lutilitoris]|uniref:hypothetical protein n=1 Tax=Martelella lutilitoris TaxID=2583532 RepID=UPI001651596C|nr:hypothetical protein [Martelella lutilitoris]